MQVAIHAGAAFTEADRLLRSLQKNSDALTQEKVGYVGPRRYRQVFRPVFEGLGKGPVEVEAYQRLKSILPSSETTRRVVFSSDSFAGDPAITLQEGQLYPLAGRRMELLEQAFPDHRIELFLALRNLGSFIPKLLMSLPDTSRDSVIRDTDLSCLNWIGMIEDIRDLAPNVPVTLWCNEDTPLIWGDIVRTVADLNESTELSDEHELLLSLLDDPGRTEAQALINQENRHEKPVLREKLAQIFEDHAQHDKVEEEVDLPGWSSEIVDAFSELYEQDVAKLETMPGVRVLRP